jgi:hypothetical protein
MLNLNLIPPLVIGGALLIIGMAIFWLWLNYKDKKQKRIEQSRR